ncbi:MAG: hypothetical protein QM831_13565 [Kofleriaceae bacterium]
MRWCALCVLAGCSFSPGASNGGDGGTNTGDDGSAPRDGDAGNALPGPLHLADGDGAAGDSPLTLSGAVTINTTDLSIATVTGPTFEMKHQLTGGEVAVLRVSSLVVDNTANVRVIGSRPLIVIASGTITINGAIDAGGHLTEAGAGGLASAAGEGSGSRGAHDGDYSDTGGGGGGFGDVAGAGGAISGCTNQLPGGRAGAMTGDPTITTLIGGSGGGAGESSACTDNLGGAGGGALQFTSSTSIHITGVINVGGGGGKGGTDCGPSDGNSGAGGGAGGAIVLQAPQILNEGVLAANGGGGGGSGTGAGGSGGNGDNGKPSTAVANGGPGSGQSGIAGGKGGAKDVAAAAGTTNTCDNNAGGGGGSVGRIAVSQGYMEQGMTSPSPSVTLPI